MHNISRRTLIIALAGLVLVVGVLALRTTGFLRSAKVRANEQFALSEHASHRGQFDVAIRHMENAVRLDPHFKEAREGLAALYEQHRGFEAAIAEYERGIKEDPKNEAFYCYRIAQMLYIDKRFEEGLKWAQRANKVQPGDGATLRLIGYCLERMKQWEQAKQHWKQVLENEPNDSFAKRGLERVQRHLLKSNNQQ